MTPRGRAVQMLAGIENGRPWMRSGSASRDDRFVDELVTGVVRWKNLLDHWIATFAKRSIDRIDPDVRRILETGLYQLHFMRVPQHAAVSESVTLAAKSTPKAKGFVNALLRNATRSDLGKMIPGDDALASVALRTGHPEWLIERWSRRFGRERAMAIAAANQEWSQPDLMVNRRRIGMEDFENALDESGAVWRRSALVDGMVRLEGSTSQVRELLDEGLAWPMDEGSAIVATMAASGEGSSVLDLAAAPGGKSFLLASMGRRVVSADASWDRLIVMKDRARRLSEDPFTGFAGDGRTPPLTGRFDTVLVDAPCSATGIIRKYPEIRWRIDPSSPGRLADVQVEMLEAAMNLADRVVYATCSLEPEENDEVVREALSRVPGFGIDDAARYVPASVAGWVDRGVLRLTPEAGTDGFTAMVLTRSKPSRKA